MLATSVAIKRFQQSLVDVLSSPQLQAYKYLQQNQVNMASSTKRLPKPQHILELKGEEKCKFIDSFDQVISDIDGVIWNLVSNVDGAGDAFKALARAGKSYSFITNNSVRTKEQYDKLFKATGLDVHYSDVIHPATNIVNYLVSINFDGLIYCIGTEYFKAILRKGGFKVIDGPNKILAETFSDLARHVFDKEPVRAVVIDVDFNLSGPKIVRAHQYLRHPDCILIAGATDMMLPVSKDIQIIGPGPYVKVLANASGKEPIIMGKPGKQLVKMLLDGKLIEDPSRTVMIGDMLEQDISFGKAAGVKTLLVLTGGCSLEDLNKNINPDWQPDYYADSITDFLKFFDNSKL